MDAESKQVGNAIVRFEAPDIVHFSNDGVIGITEIKRLFSLAAEMSQRLGKPVFLLADLSGAKGMTAEARKFPNDQYPGDKTPIVGFSFYGGGFAVRVLLTMMRKAAEALGHATYPLSYLASEAEARAWLAQERKKLTRE